MRKRNLKDGLRKLASRLCLRPNTKQTPSMLGIKEGNQTRSPSFISIDPAWSEGFDITFPAGVDLASWEPYSIDATHHPTEQHHPMYRESPQWRRRSEGQYFSRAAIALSLQHLERENTKLHMQVQCLSEWSERDLEDIRQQADAITRLQNMNALPFRTLLRKAWRLRGRYSRQKVELAEAKSEAESYRELYEEADSDLWALRAWCTGREELVMLLLAEKADLRRQYEELRETLSMHQGGCCRASECSSEADDAWAEDVMRCIDGQFESEAEDE